MAGDLLPIYEPGDRQAAAPWRLITDGVMGGLSSGRLAPDRVDGRPCIRLQGDVRLENNGGFVQAALALAGTPAEDASGFAGVLLDVHGNGEAYNLHLRTRDVRLPWQSYRASFTADARWQTLRLPFTGFAAHRIGAPLDLRHLDRLGVVAIGRPFRADLCVGRVALYR